MAGDFKIEKGVPVPPRGSPAYPFSEMAPGDSFLIPGAKSAAEIGSSLGWRQLRYKEKYRTAREPGGLRVWRIA